MSANPADKKEEREVKEKREEYYRKSLNAYPAILRENDQIVRKAFDSKKDHELTSYAQLFCLASFVREKPLRQMPYQESIARYVMNNIGGDIFKKHERVLENLQYMNSQIKDMSLSDELKEYLQFIRFIHVVDVCENDLDDKEQMIERFNHRLINIFSEMSQTEIKQADEFHEKIEWINVPSMKPI